MRLQGDLLQGGVFSQCPLLQVSTQPEIADDPCKDAKYKEATVDSMRAQKDEVHNCQLGFHDNVHGMKIQWFICQMPNLLSYYNGLTFAMTCILIPPPHTHTNTPCTNPCVYPSPM